MKKKVWDITVKDNPNRVVMGENDEFYTTDTEAYLVFKLDDKDFNPTSAVLTLENRNDGSLKNETVDVFHGQIVWEMPQRYIEHFGNWQGQLVYEDTKDGQPELYTSDTFSFVVKAHIGDKKRPSLVEIENWEKFIREGTELIETWEDMEDLRQANYQELLDTGVLQTNINTKLEALEEEYAPKLTEVTTQLAQIVVNVKSFGAVADADYYSEETQWYYRDSSMTTRATSNQQAFQDAVDYLHANGGGVLYVPQGRYKLRSFINWKTGVSMVGAGMNETILYGEGNVFDLIKATDYSSTGSDGGNPEAWLHDVRFENLQIDQKALSNPYSNVNGKALFLLYMKNARFRNLILRNTIGTALGCDFLVDTVIENVYTFNAGRNYGNPGIIDKETPVTVGQAGIGIGTGAVPEENVVIKNCFTYNSGNYGIFVETQRPNMRSKFAKIVNNHAEGNRIGISNRGSANTFMDGNSCFKNDEAGILVNHKGFGDMITNNYLLENKGSGLSVMADYIGDLLVANNKISKNDGDGIFLGTSATEHLEDIKIDSNIIDHNGYAGVYINNKDGEKHKNIKFLNNTIYNNQQGPGSNVTGMTVVGVENLQLKGNTFYDNQEYPTQKNPIAIGKTVTGFIDGNDFGEEQESLQINYSSAIEIGNNVGLKNRASGKVTFAEGEKHKAVDHFLGNQTNRPITFVALTPTGSISQHVFPSDTSQLNGLSIARENESSELTVFWEARVDY